MLEPVKRAIERYKSIFRRADLSPLALSGAYSLSPDGSKLAFHSAYRQWPVDGAICSRCSRATTATLSRCNTCWTHERRRWPRYPFNFPVRVWKRTAAQLVIVDGFASELNQGGMAICSPLQLATRSLLSSQPLCRQRQCRSRVWYAAFTARFMVLNSCLRPRQRSARWMNFATSYAGTRHFSGIHFRSRILTALSPETDFFNTHSRYHN